ncbi:MAG: hypothetical protein JWO76_3018 [Nocardioides sp.]|nr:hypothetical protein [Nocardioides sp.]
MHPSRPCRLSLAVLAVLLAATLAACGLGGRTGDADSPAPTVPTDAGYDTPAASPTPTGVPDFSASPAEVRVYLHRVAWVWAAVARLDRHFARIKGDAPTDRQARIVLMRHDLPVLRTLGQVVAEMPVRGGDLPRLHRLLVDAVRAQVRGYELWSRAWRLHAVSMVPRANEQLAAARTAKDRYFAAVRSLGGRVPV